MKENNDIRNGKGLVMATTMQMVRRSRLFSLVAACVLLSARPVYAEDIQIYLQAGSESAGANVVFLLETAGQVNTNFANGHPACPGRSVSDEMFCAMDMVVNALSGNMRVGIAAQNRGGTDGGHIGFTVTNLEETAGTRVVSRVRTELADAVQDRASRDDPWNTIDVQSGQMRLPGNRGNAGHLEATRRVGFVFNDVAIPSWAKVTSARLELRMPASRSGSGDAYVAFEEVDHPALFADRPGEDLADRVWSDTVASDLKMEGTQMSIDVSAAMQGAVARTDWCGRNSVTLMIDRTSFGGGSEPLVYSYRAQNADGNRLGQPELVVEWDPDTAHGQPAGEQSCMGGVRLDLQADADDGSESLSKTSVVTSSEQLLAGRNANPNGVSDLNNNQNYMSGLRFNNVAFGSDTRIADAKLNLRVDEAGSQPLIIRPMLGNTPAFAGNGSISSRPVGAAIETTVAAGNEIVDVTDAVRSILTSAGWAPGGALGFRLEAKNATTVSERIKIQAREGGAASAFLVMSVLSNKPGDFAQSLTRRDEVRVALDNMQSGAGGGNTKTGASYVETIRYLREMSPRYGNQDYADPNAFSDASRSRYTGVDYDIDECPGETHVIMVSNKDPNGQDPSEAAKGYQELSGNTCSAGDQSGWGCIQSLAGYLRSEGIVTHAVNFAETEALADKMKKVAARGGGEYRYASNALELSEVIAEILDSIVISDASMAAPGVAVNQLNRFRHLDQLYYALFRPSLDTRWDGNLKRYRLDFSTEPPTIVDERGRAAVDPTTGFFRGSSNSWWGMRDDGLDLDDGSDVTLGGAREELEMGNTQRRLLVAETSPSAGGSASATTKPAGMTLHQVRSSADISSPLLLGMESGASDAEVQSRVEFLLDGWGDPLHSEPRLVNYGFQGSFGDASLDDSLQDNTLFVSTNDGMLHAIEAKTGKELFTFMPPEELAKTDDRFVGGRLDADDPQRTTYGLDGGITVWRQASGDGSGSARNVFLYAAQRRGGRNYYALDATDRENPRLLWSINGGSGAFSNLGQSWAAPTLAQIVLDGKLVPVLVIGGGYSPDDHDTTGSVSGGDSMGNGIYIVNANNGALIWSASSSGATVNHPDMKWAMPAAVSVVDVDFNGVLDYLYATDLGGQVFRVDFNHANTGSSDLVHRVVTLAKLGASDPDTSGIGNHRRFHSSPVVALGRRDGETLLQVSVGSGYRAHPLDTRTNDRIYLLDDVDALDARGPGTITSPPITETRLLDVTNNLEPDPSEMEGKRGWMIRLESGEKVLAPSVITEGVIFMSSYLPETAYADKCQRVIGSSRLYGLRLSDGGPALRDSSGDLVRSEDLILPGLPPTPQVLLGPEAERVVLVGTAAVDVGPSGGFGLRRTRWYEVPTEAEADAVLQETMMKTEQEE